MALFSLLNYEANTFCQVSIVQSIFPVLVVRVIVQNAKGVLVNTQMILEQVPHVSNLIIYCFTVQL